ncbi:MAG: polymorphic toxin-type HINT domain-containing protein [Planctomycetota bacterium]
MPRRCRTEWYVVERGWILAKDIKNGDVLITEDGRYVAVRGLWISPLEQVTYNFEVAAAHTFFVGENGGLLVHNDSYQTARRYESLASQIHQMAGLHDRVTIAISNYVDETGARRMIIATNRAWAKRPGYQSS